MGKRILILDDDPIMLDTLGIMLEIQGYEVRCIGSATLLEATFKDFRPELLLMDIHLDEEVDGRILCNEIKAGTDGGTIPIVLVSGLSYAQISAIESCADAVLGKPFDVDNILLTIKHLLEQE